MTRQEAVEIAQAIPAQVPTPNKLSFILVWALTFIMAVTYAYFVNQTVMNIVERKNVENQIATLESDVSNLEFDFIAQKNTINLEFAYSQGFEDILDTRYITRLDNGNRLTLQDISSYEEIQ